MTTNDKLREALETIAKLHIIGPMTSEQGRQLMLVTDIAQEALAASKQEPTTCGHCTYEESDGSLIEQCQACKDKDSKQEPMRLEDVHGVVCGGPASKQEPQSNRTHVDSGALTMALNVLRRAGKNEVADALEQTAVRGEQEPQAQAEPDWSESETASGELWKNPLRPMAENLLVADGAIHHRDLVIKNLREQLAKKDAALDACVEAKEVLDAIDSGEWTVTRHLPQGCFTKEANAKNAWSVQRGSAPYCDKEGFRVWFGATAAEALRNGKSAITQSKEARK